MSHSKFLYILRCALAGEALKDLSLSSDEAKEILSLAETHKILPLIYDCIHSCLSEEFSSLHQKVKYTVALQTLRTEAFKTLYKALRESGNTPVVVKGILCRNLYPKPDLRISADEDLLIPKQDFTKFKDALNALGFTQKDESCESYQTAFVRADGFYVELHTTLFDTTDYFSKWNEFFKQPSSENIWEDTDGLKLLTLSPTDHLLYLILHALKHFIHSGVGIRQVCDILLFIRKHKTSIDFDYVFAKCEEAGALRFAAGLLAVCKNHLCSNTLSFDIPMPDINVDETALLEDILHAGVYGGSTGARRHSGSLTFAAAKNGKKQRLIRRVFPKAQSLDRRYSYAKRNTALLPLAWGHRLINYRKETKNSENNSPKEALSIGNNRLLLMEEYGLINDKK